MTKFATIVVITILICVAAGVGLYFFLDRQAVDTNVIESPASTTVAAEIPEVDDTKTVIGRSMNGHDITAYHYGDGDTEVLFVGGIHGGYAWNTVLLAYELMDHLEDDPTAIPENVRVTVIPVLNPDGLERVVGSSTERFQASDVSANEEEQIAGRFNGRQVDLNRNFDCEWNATATWQQQSVNPGAAAFSEPESQALRDYVTKSDPNAVVVWYSAAGGVFASSCNEGVLADTKDLTDLYARASQYRAYQDFNFYEITGDMVNWLAREEVAAISVLLSTHESTEWEKNWLGIEAVLNYYAR